MKFHWGTGIVTVFLLFVAGILALVIMAMSRDVDLVTDHPYDRGLAYESRLAALQRTAALKEKPTVTTVQQAIIVRFPWTVSDAVDGTISMYRPDNRSRDRAVPVAPDSAGTQVVHFDSPDRGLWRIAVAWTREGLDYYLEQPIMLY